MRHRLKSLLLEKWITTPLKAVASVTLAKRINEMKSQNYLVCGASRGMTINGTKSYVKGVLLFTMAFG